MVSSLFFTSSFPAPKRGIAGVWMSGTGGDSFTFGIKVDRRTPIRFPGSQE